MPAGIPKQLILLLILLCLLTGLSGFRMHGLDGYLRTLEYWLIMLVIIPSLTTLVAYPFYVRDASFDLRLTYYMGMFVALLFMLSKFRYWR